MGYGDMASMFHGMIAPFAGYPVEGAIWYQGESNANNDAEAKAYADLLPLLVRSWRASFGRPDMPFGVVSLAAFRAYTPDQPVSGHWPQLRASQLATEGAVPNVGVVTTIDVGNAGDIHPRDKRTVGQRLAHWAMATAYGKTVTAWHGPRARSINRNGETLEIEFDVEGGRIGTRDGKDPAGFVLVDAAGNASWATGTIVGANRVSLKVPADSKPVAVRYAWQDNPANANLADTAHALPAHPFRMDVPN
jgi:sialate O-acetylesterase